MHIPDAGLCDHCRHCKKTSSPRGSVFRLCLLHEKDARFAKYPPLPVIRCVGYEKRAGSESPPKPS
jgi:hypothetical protein